ncbi:MAG: APC family permease [Pseudanabaena sp.]|nr:MAG: APC family permease [Pseudanabaena sp.]
MSDANRSGDGELKPTLGLIGVTINAMALIAPGAFLWTTFQLQSPRASALNMWASVAIATGIALLTASCFATLSKAYSGAGAGSSYYYAEAAIIAKEEHKHFRFARIIKFLVGWSSHLYYWVYPGVMVAFMGTLVVYIGELFNPDFASSPVWQIVICVVFAIFVGIIALFGVTGSTLVNIIINIIQIVSLVFLGILFIVYRFGHPEIQFEHANALSVVLPHDFPGLIFQVSIAILLVVGFESATALAGEAINPKRDVPKAVILSLVIQACICYFFEYFGANFFIGNAYAGVVNKAGEQASFVAGLDPKITDFGAAIKALSLDPTKYDGGSILTGFDAAYVSGAPIGDMARILGDTILGGHGFALVLIMAISVLLALIGTTLSSLSTGVRITYAMGIDGELPKIFGKLHRQFRTPHIGIIFLTLISAAIGGYGVLNVNNLTQVTLMSNIGTFIFYGLTCLVTLVATLDHLLDGETNPINTIVIPILGAILNFAMLIAVFYFGFTAGGDSARNAQIAIGAGIAFFAIGFAYIFIQGAISGRTIFLPHDVSHPLREESFENRR